MPWPRVLTRTCWSTWARGLSRITSRCLRTGNGVRLPALAAVLRAGGGGSGGLESVGGDQCSPEKPLRVRRERPVDQLTAFTAETFGGPERFTQEYGFQHRNGPGRTVLRNS